MASSDVEKTSDELRMIEKTINLLNSNGSKEKSGYWTRKVKIINRVFLIVYITAVILFLAILFSLWITPENHS